MQFQPKKEAYRKLYGLEKMLVTSIFSFSQNIFYTIKQFHYWSYV